MYAGPFGAERCLRLDDMGACCSSPAAEGADGPTRVAAPAVDAQLHPTVEPVPAAALPVAEPEGGGRAHDYNAPENQPGYIASALAPAAHAEALAAAPADAAGPSAGPAPAAADMAASSTPAPAAAPDQAALWSDMFGTASFADDAALPPGSVCAWAAQDASRAAGGCDMGSVGAGGSGAAGDAGGRHTGADAAATLWLLKQQVAAAPAASPMAAPAATPAATSAAAAPPAVLARQDAASEGCHCLAAGEAGACRATQASRCSAARPPADPRSARRTPHRGRGPPVTAASSKFRFQSSVTLAADLLGASAKGRFSTCE